MVLTRKKHLWSKMNVDDDAPKQVKSSATRIIIVSAVARVGHSATNYQVTVCIHATDNYGLSLDTSSSLIAVTRAYLIN